MRHLATLAAVLVARGDALVAPRASSVGASSVGASRARASAAPLARPTTQLFAADPTSLLALGSDADVVTLFNVATFGPQPLWILLILSGLGVKAPAEAVMRPWAPLIAFSLVHLAIVVVSATQADGVAPIAEFNEVFDATGFPFSPAPQAAMQHMMQYVNFVSEEWPHVLVWDLFVGRFIWLDGEERGVFTPHSVLLTNLIGPPGLLLHLATCVLTGKGLPPVGEARAED